VIPIGRKGKFQEWLTEDGLTRLTGWARDGLTDEQIAQNIGINRATLYDWIKRYDNIANAIKKGKEPVDIQVENALLRRALGYDYEETITEIEDLGNNKTKKHVRRVTKHVPPDTTAQIFWLKNRKPKQWRDKMEAAVSVDTEDLSPLVELLKDG
jgi:transposase-like protein